MVVFDTSVWIEYFKGNQDFQKKAQNLLDSREVYALEPIFGELLQGALHKREVEVILKFWKYLPKFELANLFIEAGELAYREKLVSHGIRLVDASIILLAVENKARLWTLDKKILRFLDEKYIYN